MNVIEDICEVRSQVSGDALAAVTRRRSDVQHPLLIPISLPFRLPTPIYGAMLAIWHLRPVLQRRFPLHKGKPRDFVRFLAWCASEGRRQFVILREIPEWDAALSQPVALPPLENDRWANGFSVAMFLYGVSRYHYTTGAMLRDASARHRIARAYWRGERHKRLLPLIPAWQCDVLNERFGSVDKLIEVIWLKHQDAEKETHQLLEEFGLADVLHAFEGVTTRPRDVSAPPDRVPLPEKMGRGHIRLPLRVLRSLSWLEQRYKSRPTAFELTTITNRIAVRKQPPQSSPYPFGVNLFGYAKGEIGIGEDVRLVALALKAHGIPFCIVNVQPGANVSQQDRSAEEWIVSEPRYAINIFCTTGIEQTRYGCEQGLSVFRDRYNIGLWPWELPNWPTSCNHAFSMVDEIWGISRYTASAYFHAPCPVYAMTLPVTIEGISQETREDFGLPADDYLFVFSFDFNSTLSRKNPMAVIRAFQIAFPQSMGERVGLVLKASHVRSDNPEWKRIKALVDADPRIRVIDTTLRRPQVLALYRACDCYVSLHRAEGFGRSLAEALLLDRQLIATAFSGNLDFCSEERVGLVRYALRDVNPGEYFFGEGQQWADPSIAHAADLMREIYTNPRKLDARSFDFGPTSVGSRYSKRLREIQQDLRLREEAISC